MSLFLAYESCKDRFDRPITFEEFKTMFADWECIPVDVKSSGSENLPTGVVESNNNSFNPFSAKLKYLGVSFSGGVYDNVERAHRVYLKFRKEMVKDIIEIYGNSVDERVYVKLLETCEPEYYGYT